MARVGKSLRSDEWKAGSEGRSAWVQRELLLLKVEKTLLVLRADGRI